LTGLVQGGVLKVDVMVGRITYQATIVNGVWSVTVPLVAGENDVWVKAYPIDADCTPVQKDIIVKYTINNVCTAPINYLHIDSPLSGFVTNSGTAIVQ
jgi:hypothetical protein